MPPPRRQFGCKGPCHLIWWGREGQLTIGCAHCKKVTSRTDFAGGEELLERQVKASQKGHQKNCSRSVR